MRKLILDPGERGYKKQQRAERNRYGVVYFVEAVGLDLVKIGYTLNMDQRISNLLSVCPVPVEILGEMPGGPEKEQELHRLFAADRSHGEWFRKTDALTAYIAQHATESIWAGVARMAGERRPPNPMTRAAVRAKAETPPSTETLIEQLKAAISLPHQELERNRG